MIVATSVAMRDSAPSRIAMTSAWHTVMVFPGRNTRPRGDERVAPLRLEQIDLELGFT